ncbi:diguanylate cyclase (GGDEF) domain-containing protein [Thermus arciformis]|uniref:Diguanylate cyclase (GGDEF) domain-containing protein n=1 Tax=Thermus arciformis TaxID=482827 RepID=A0A1G7DLY2_9DEIN|nr:EAL domain-containing protein [Thermus arciformis]SDE52508.1 diguanylate cyclase (GGDEF) domain-containing protein [Thermus arciformis]
MDGLQAHRLAEALLPLLREGLSGLPEALRALGEGLRAHRAYLFRLEEREGRWYASQLAEWAGVGATPQIQNPALQDLPMEEAGYGRWLRLFREDRAVAGPVRAFPESERPLLEAQEIQSLLVVPVRVDGALWGFLGVDDCQRERSFGPEEEAFLRTVAEALARVLDLFARHHSLERLLAQTSFHLARFDPRGRLLWANAPFREAFSQPPPLPLAQALAHPGQPQSATLQGWEWTLLAIPGPGGEVLEVFALGVDVRERLEAQAREARWNAFRKNLLRIYETLMAEGLSDSIFGLILEAALDTIPSAQAGSVTVLMEDGYYHFVAAKGYDLEALRQVRLHPLEPLSLTGHKEAQVFTWKELERFNQRLDPKRREVMERAGRTREIRAILSVPVYLAGERKAFLYLDNFEREDAFAPLDLELAQAFASQLGLLLRRLELEGRLHHLAYHDPLTGLPNRVFFLERLAQALKEKASQLAVLYLDLDGLKLVNDLDGHAVGDEAIRVVAARLQAALRPRDLVARQGGDEFLVLLTHLKGPEEATAVAERLLEVMRLPLPVGERVYHLTTSIGLALGEEGLPPGELLKRADLALYRAKAEGKNRLAFYEAHLQEGLRQEMALLEALQQDLERGENLYLAYQPIVDLKTGEEVAKEALLRWPLAPPSTFIPLAERHRLMPALGAFVLRQACLARSRHGLPVHVNVSPQELLDPGYPARVAAILEETGCPPEGLVLEVTESALIPDERGREASESLRILRGLGVRIYLDDFGTGYSSLERLASLPVNGLKLGQGFTRALGNPPRPDTPPARLVAALLALAQTLGLEAIAEGIEDEATLAYLRDLGFRLGQGYLLGRPVP